jgi:hypothetical protein
MPLVPKSVVRAIVRLARRVAAIVSLGIFSCRRSRYDLAQASPIYGLGIFT